MECMYYVFPHSPASLTPLQTVGLDDSRNCGDGERSCTGWTSCSCSLSYEYPAIHTSYSDNLVIHIFVCIIMAIGNRTCYLKRLTSVRIVIGAPVDPIP